MKTSIAVLAMVALLFTGCTANLSLVPQDITVAGQPHHYVFATGIDKNSGSFSVMNSYDNTGKLETNNAAMNPGILPAALNGAVGGAFMATGLGVGLGHSGSNIVQNAKGASATTGAATGGTATATGGAGGAGGIG